MATGQAGAEIGVGMGPTLTCNHEAPVVAYRTSPNWGAWETGDKVDTLTTGTDPASHLLAFRAAGQDGFTASAEVAPPIAATDGGGSGVPTIAFSCKDHGQDAGEDVAPTLRAMAGNHANGGGQVAIAAFQNTGQGKWKEAATAGTVRASDGGGARESTVIAFQDRIARNGRGQPSEIAPALSGADAGATSDMRPCVATASAVRRLTPLECERLQGFPDHYTLIPGTQRRKAERDFLAHLLAAAPGISVEEAERLAADAPRYKALGNSWAVPVVRLIGERIAMVDKL